MLLEIGLLKKTKQNKKQNKKQKQKQKQNKTKAKHKKFKTALSLG